MRTDRSAATTEPRGYASSELERPEELTAERLAEVARICLLRWDAYPGIPGSVRWRRDGISAVMELERRVERLQAKLAEYDKYVGEFTRHA